MISRTTLKFCNSFYILYFHLLHKIDKLTQLWYVFRHIPNLHWIVIEDSNTKTNQVSTFFAENCNVKYTYLNVGSPAYSRKLKGFAQRNEGMNWVRQHFRDSSNRKEGVLYFVDDDDTYSINFF